MFFRDLNPDSPGLSLFFDVDLLNPSGQDPGKSGKEIMSLKE